jgi:hypothetical protein
MLNIENSDHNLLLSITTIGYIISSLTANNILTVLTILVAIAGIINYYYNIRKTRLEIKQLKEK